MSSDPYGITPMMRTVARRVMRGSWRRMLLAVCVFVWLWVPTRAQAPEWSPPILLSGAENALSPVVLCPADGTVHVLWGTTVPEADPRPAAIFHVQVSGRGPLSDPVDVIAIPASQAIDLDAATDGAGMVHLVWSSGSVYYSSAPLACLASARCWSTPVRLSDAQAVSPSVRVGPDGAVHVLYVDVHVSPYVQHVVSYDGGATWEHTGPVSQPVGRAYALNTQLAIGPDGRLHASWAESVEAFPPSGVYYASSDDGGRNWTEPRAIAEGGYTWPSVFVTSQGRVHLFWTGTGAWTGKYHTWSLDKGVTWMANARAWPDLAGILGTNGLAELGGELHLVGPVGGLPVNTFNATGIIHSVWLGDGWSAPSLLTRATDIPYFEFGYARACAPSSGDALVAVWHSLNYHNVPIADNHPNDFYVWYALLSSNHGAGSRVGLGETTARAAEATPPPTPAPTPTPVAETVATAAGQMTETSRDTARAPGGALPLAYGVAGALGFLLLWLGVARRRVAR